MSGLAEENHAGITKPVERTAEVVGLLGWRKVLTSLSHRFCNLVGIAGGGALVREGLWHGRFSTTVREFPSQRQCASEGNVPPLAVRRLAPISCDGAAVGWHGQRGGRRLPRLVPPSPDHRLA